MVEHGEVTGYRYKGETKDRLWGIHIPLDRDNPQRAYIKVEKPTGNPLAVEQRDAAIKSIIQQLPLSSFHKKDLLKRGLTEKDCQEFVTIGKDSYLETPVTSDLAGVAIDGRHFGIAPGYLVPIKNIDGYYTGFQVRTAETENKYRWLVSRASSRRAVDATSHLPNGELPLQHCLTSDTSDLYLMEGTLKPKVAHKKHTISTIGGSGGRFGEEQLKTAITTLTPERVILCPDAGSLANTNVLSAYETLAQQIEMLGYDLLVLDWGQGSDKLVKDIDEIDALTFSKAKVIPLKEWAKDAWKAQKKKASNLSWKKLRQFTPDITLNEEYCSSPLFPNDGEIVALKYYTGQGKSTWIGNQIMATKLDAFSFFNRNSLSAQFAEKFDFIQMSEIKESEEFKEYDKLIAAKLLGNGESIRVCSCLESLLAYPLNWFDGAVLVLDELESTLRQALSGGTLKHRQNEILNRFKEVLMSCSRIILADGNLSDTTCEFIEYYSGKKLTKYYNSKLPTRPNTKIYDGFKDYSEFIPQIISERNPWVICDSQKTCEALELRLNEEGKKTIRFDAITTKNNHKELYQKFLKTPDLVLDELTKCLGEFTLITSPVIESGIDITWPHFSAVYQIALHLEINSQSQMLMRARDINCPRHIVCKKSSFSIDDDLTYHTAIYNTYSSMAKNMLAANMKQLLDGAEAEDIALLSPLSTQYINSIDYKLANTFECIRNYERSYFRESFIERLKESGFDVDVVDLQYGQTADAQFKECKKTVKVKHSTDIATAQDIEEEVYRKRKERKDLNWQEKCEVDKFKFKYLLNQEILTIEDIYLLLFTNTRAISQLELRAYITRYDQKKTKELARLKRNPTLTTFHSDLGFIKLIHELEIIPLIESLLKPDIKFDANHPDVRKLWEKWKYQDFLVTKIERGKSPIILLQRITKKIGYGLVVAEKTKSAYLYRIVDQFAKHSDWVESVAQRVDREANELLERSSTKLKKTPFSPPTLNNDNLKLLKSANQELARETEVSNSISAYTEKITLLTNDQSSTPPALTSEQIVFKTAVLACKNSKEINVLLENPMFCEVIDLCSKEEFTRIEEICATPPPEPRNKFGPFIVGDTVKHFMWGIGEIREVLDDKLYRWYSRNYGYGEVRENHLTLIEPNNAS